MYILQPDSSFPEREFIMVKKIKTKIKLTHGGFNRNISISPIAAAIKNIFFNSFLIQTKKKKRLVISFTLRCS